MAGLQQRTDAWFAARRGRLTASNLGASLGLVSYVSRPEAYRRVTGASEFVGNPACDWGTTNEANATVSYQIASGNTVQPVGLFIHKDYDWLAGSPDGFVGEDGMVEIKCPFYHKKDGSPRVHAAVPIHYWCQVNALLEITEREWCDYVSWTPEGMRTLRVPRDKEAFDFLLNYYGQFYAAMARGDAAPPPLPASEKARIVECIERAMEKVK